MRRLFPPSGGFHPDVPPSCDARGPGRRRARVGWPTCRRRAIVPVINSSTDHLNGAGMGDRDTKTALFDEFARVGKALASGRRMELLDVLANGERSVEALARELDLSVANTSQHLQVLRRAGLVAARREGTSVHYRLAGPEVVRLWQAVRTLAAGRLAEVERPPPPPPRGPPQPGRWPPPGMLPSTPATCCWRGSGRWRCSAAGRCWSAAWPAPTWPARSSPCRWPGPPGGRCGGRRCLPGRRGGSPPPGAGPSS